MTKRYFNVGTALLMQAVSIVCGLITPRLLISSYGPEAYGATVSIAQFLSCITLLEGGMGAVARAELYVPLAMGDKAGIASVYGSMKGFFRKLAGAFLLYTIVLSCCFHDIAAVNLWERKDSICLVLVMGISTGIQYILGVSDTILLNADCRQYVTQLAFAFCTALNTVTLFILTQMGSSLLMVKFCAALIFLLRPLILHWWRDHFFPSLQWKKRRVLAQSRYGFGQHMAYFLHRNTDIVLLTLFGNLKLTAIYSLYLLVCGNLRNLCIGFSTGMEAEFGKCYAEKANLQESFHRYESLMCKLSLALFSVAALLILPFLNLYTNGLKDISYQQPLFAGLLLAAELQYCQLQPYYALPLAANCFKETRWAAYGEAVLNIALSCLLLQIWEPLPAVVTGTIVAQSLRALWLRHYISKNFLQISSLWKMVWPLFLILLLITVELPISNWLQWIISGFLLTGCMIFLLFGGEMKRFIERRQQR